MSFFNLLFLKGVELQPCNEKSCILALKQMWLSPKFSYPIEKKHPKNKKDIFCASYSYLFDSFSKNTSLVSLCQSETKLKRHLMAMAFVLLGCNMKIKRELQKINDHLKGHKS